jgi:hypothetical protein
MSIGNIVDTIQNVLAAAQRVTAAIPGLQGVSGMIGTANALSEVGEKLVGVIDGLTSSAPDARTQEEMQTTRAALAAAVSKKAVDTANRLDG